MSVLRDLKRNKPLHRRYNTIGIPVAAGVLFPVLKVTLPPELAGGAMVSKRVRCTVTLGGIDSSRGDRVFVLLLRKTRPWPVLRLPSPFSFPHVLVRTSAAGLVLRVGCSLFARPATVPPASGSEEGHSRGREIRR